ncbi:hypothetical protein TcWFU_001977 [Taenia crassiceps]|uniref:Uncharacterized protein n=1 Tax=Taenia crassiceps TaxID=6207 RepID=A0ABR4QK04_9CEST
MSGRLDGEESDSCSPAVTLLLCTGDLGAVGVKLRRDPEPSPLEEAQRNVQEADEEVEEGKKEKEEEIKG